MTMFLPYIINRSEIISDISFEFAIGGVMVTMASLFGLIGNILAMIVLSKPAMKSKFNYILIGKLKICKGWL